MDICWANSNLKCNTCSKLVYEGESVNQASMAVSLSAKEEWRGAILTKPTLRLGSLDQGVALQICIGAVIDNCALKIP
jgi:hypothetical protein